MLDLDDDTNEALLSPLKCSATFLTDKENQNINLLSSSRKLEPFNSIITPIFDDYIEDIEDCTSENLTIMCNEKKDLKSLGFFKWDRYTDNYSMKNAVQLVERILSNEKIIYCFEKNSNYRNSKLFICPCVSKCT